MAYATVSQFSDRLGTPLYARLTDRVNGTIANATVAQQILDEAEAEANSYFARRFATPLDLTAHPELASLLRQRVLDLAEYAAWRSSPFLGDAPARVQAAYSQALQWFEEVAAGRSELPAATTPALRAPPSAGPLYSGERVFTESELDGL